jgi:hypothetical protein
MNADVRRGKEPGGEFLDHETHGIHERAAGGILGREAGHFGCVHGAEEEDAFGEFAG